MDQANKANYKAQLDTLHQAGFTTLEIRRLLRFRQLFLASEQDQAPADLAHLQFIRWLVEHGRLTDQLT